MDLLLLNAKLTKREDDIKGVALRAIASDKLDAQTAVALWHQLYALADLRLELESESERTAEQNARTIERLLNDAVRH